MKCFGLCVFGVLAFLSAAPALGDAISNIQLDPDPVAGMKYGQHVDITFDYTIQTPGGVRIFARPITNGNLTPDYGASGSPLYPQGSGSGSGYFTIYSGDVIVDDIRFQIWTADQSQLILEFFYQVTYYFTDDAIFNIQMDPPSPSSIKFNQHLNINFDYETDFPGGVRIFARPFTNGALTPNYAASGSPLYPTGSGSGNGYFTITCGDVTVDLIRFRMYNADQSILLLEFFVPVEYEFHPASVYYVSTNPTSPVGWLIGEDIEVDFSYQADEPVYIWARPYTQGSPSPNYAASGSPLYPAGTGAGSGTFTITSGEVTIDAIRFHVMDASMSTTLLTYFVPADIHFCDHVVIYYTLEHPSPAYFTCDHRANLEFFYYTTEPNGVRIWALPYTHGSYTPGGYYGASPVYPFGFGTGQTFVGASIPSLVDGLYFLMTNPDQSQTLMEWLTPVSLHFGNQLPSDVALDERPAVNSVMFEAIQSPLSAGTTIRYILPTDASVSLRVYDTEGRQVAVLVDEVQEAGLQGVDFNAAEFKSGVYFCRLDAEGRLGSDAALVDIQRLVVIR